MEHNNRPMKALYEALLDTTNQGIELPMAIIMDQRCGIERRAEEADVPRYLVGVTPLLLAISAGRVDVAKDLLAAGADPNAKDSTGETSLMAATHNCDLEAIESLIGYGADINAVDEDDRTALHNAASHLNANAIERYTILHYATNRRHASVIELLQRSGANLEAVDDKGWTPLHKAASICRVGTINALLKLGANQGAVDNEGRTPLHCAATNVFVSDDAIEAFRCNVAAFEANLTAVDKNGHTPLQVYESCPRSSFYYSDARASKVRASLTPTMGFAIEKVDVGAACM